MRYILNQRYEKCCACKKSLRNKNKNNNNRRIGTSTLERNIAFFKDPNIKLNDLICRQCSAKSEKGICSLKNNNGPNINNNSSLHNPDLDFESSNSASEYSKECESKNESNDSDTIQTLFKKDGRKIELHAASFTKGHCLMCKKKSGLITIKPESIIFAYQNYGLLIRKDSRCCISHLDINGDIKYEESEKITKANHLYEKAPVEIIDICLSKIESIQNHLNDSCGIFDKFRNVASLDENLCKQITGWYKKEFMEFTAYIKNVRDTAGRTKEQLVAIYRYWLMKGLDQNTLALLKCNTSQQQISHYLEQIRNAMNEEFVPQFLGTKKGIEFFLKHNTESVKILHDFTDETLAVIADGTYTRLEKSSNNEFQYVSYSLQKLDHLIKPFILCCADGYFIDCYGQFRATFNDADILKYILATDQDLKELLIIPKNIYLFLERGK